MELGYLVYFLVVFIFGGLLLLVLAIYFIRELFLKKEQWDHRSTRSKVFLLAATALSAFVLSVPCRMIWVTRLGAVPGTYRAEGVWGKATMQIRPNGTFTETWQFKNEYTGKPEGDGSREGTWRDSRRDWFTRDIVLSPFKPLAEYDRAHIFKSFTATMEGYSGRTAMNVDYGSDIYFVK